MIKKFQFTDYLPGRSKFLKFFLIGLALSLPFWWGINVLERNLEDFFFWKLTEDLEFKTQVSQPLIDYSSLKPIRNWEVEDLEIEAKSAISVEITKNGKQKVLFEKTGDLKLPIASLTKLMTAYLVLENNYDLSDEIKITQEMVEQEGDAGYLKVGDIFRIKDLLHISLMESSNDAAYALSGAYLDPGTFINVMNSEAKNLGLKDTYFTNSTGLDPDNPKNPINYSTANDFVKFTQSLLEKPLIFDILSTPEMNLYLPNGVNYKIENTNELLKENLGWSSLIVGGKTGWTPQARGCLLLVLRSQKADGYLINVIFGSENRFEEMKKLVNWIITAYKW